MPAFVSVIISLHLTLYIAKATVTTTVSLPACVSGRPAVRPSVHLSVCLSVGPPPWQPISSVLPLSLARRESAHLPCFTRPTLQGALNRAPTATLHYLNCAHCRCDRGGVAARGKWRNAHSPHGQAGSNVCHGGAALCAIHSHFPQSGEAC